MFRHSLGTYQDVTDVSYHFDYDSAIDFAKTHQVDCAFLDVSLIKNDGISLAKDLRKLCPTIEFVFVTGHDDFARAAYEVGGRAYLTKPYHKEELHRALSLMHRLTQPLISQKSNANYTQPFVMVKTFGSFDLFVNHVPVYFKHSKAKELLAFLIHQRGSSVTSAQIFYTLWNCQAYTHDNSTYVRRTIRQLKDELTTLGIEDILVSMRNSYHIDTTKLLCDAYELLNGNEEAISAFSGIYMSQYPWAKAQVKSLEDAVTFGQAP